MTAAQWGAAVVVGATAVIAANHWLDTAGKGKSQLQEFKQDLPAWSATLLLVLQPLEQLVRRV